MVAIVVGLIFALIFFQVVVKVREYYPEAAVALNNWFQLYVVMAFLASLGIGGTVYCAISVNASRDLAESMQKLSTGARSIENQSLIINSFSTIFYYACFIDVKEDSFYEILPQDFITFIFGERGKFSTAYKRFVDETVSFDFQDEMHEFGDVFTVDRRLDTQKSVTTEFISNYVGWTRTYLIASERDENGKVTKMLLGFQKIDAQKRHELQMQEALKSALESANSANNAKSDFLSRMSHDIRTPMNGIVGMTALALTRIDDKERVTYCLEKISDSGKHLLMLINDVLDMSRIDTGRLELSEEKFSLSDLTDNLVTMIHSQTDAKHQDLICNVVNVEHENVIGDPTRLEEVFLNLAGNAVKYTGEQGRIKISIFEKFIKNGMGFYEFVIEDNGIGMSEEFMSHIFEPFSREYNEKTKNVQGTGLGLAIAKNIITMMNGSISVESEYGKGSVFIIEVPQKIISCEPVGDFKAQFEKDILATKTYKEAFMAPDARILVVDDTRVNLTVARGLLKSTQIQIDTAGSGDESTELTLKRSYDLILMDQRMPGMDGTKALKIIREQEEGLNRETPVICLTADAIIGAKERYISEGFTDYLAKPINNRELLKIMAEYLPQEKIIR